MPATTSLNTNARVGAPKRAGFDLHPATRAALLTSGIVIGAVSAYALGRASLGLAPTPPQAREIAVVIHLATVLPSLPLGLYIFLSRKGGTRHRVLGRVWMALMMVTAVAALFIRHLNDGQFSYVHLASLVTLVGIPLAIKAAREKRIAAHRSHLISMFVGALLVSGVLSFLPGRIMRVWLFG
jgi:uncharacterized membrane protein